MHFESHNPFLSLRRSLTFPPLCIRKAFIRQFQQARSTHTEEIEHQYGQVMANGDSSKKLKIVWAEQDALIPLEKGEILRERIKPAEFVLVKDAGHLVMVDQPEIVVYEIATWLAKMTAQ